MIEAKRQVCEPDICLTDPTLAGCKDPAKKLKRLEEQRKHIKEEIEMLKDRDYCIAVEIAGLRAAQR